MCSPSAKGKNESVVAHLLRIKYGKEILPEKERTAYDAFKAHDEHCEPQSYNLD